MLKSSALEHFKTPAALAAALGITVQAVSQWDELIPELTAYRLQSLTRGKLKVDRSLYAKGSARKQALERQAAQ